MCFLSNSNLLPNLILFVPTSPTYLSFNLPSGFWIVPNKTHLLITEDTKVQFFVMICFFILITIFAYNSSRFHIPLPFCSASFAFTDNLFSTDRAVAKAFFKPPFFLLFFQNEFFSLLNVAVSTQKATNIPFLWRFVLMSKLLVTISTV
jgi:hypothetical protein